MTDSVLYSLQNNGVGIVTFNRPYAMNALTIEAMEAFYDIVEHVGADPFVKALILTGAGKEAFCSGGDLTELKEFTDTESARGFITTMGNALLALERLPFPVIAAINGFALGGGSEIALACDMRIVDETVKMGMVHITLAVTPGWGAGQRLLRLVGYSTAMELLLTAKILQVEDLKHLGIANISTPGGMALQSALEFANAIAQKPSQTVQAIKSLLQAGLNQPYEQALKIERDLFPPQWSSEAHQRAVIEFFERQHKKNRE